MSQPVVNCTKCGKPKAPPVITHQAREAWPTRVADIQYMLKKFGWGVPDLPQWVPSNKPVTVNENRMGVPDPPPWVEPSEPAPPVLASPRTSLRTHAATQPPSEPFMFIPPPPWVPTDKQEGPIIFR
jgi:hypothetical protein